MNTTCSWTRCSAEGEPCPRCGDQHHHRYCPIHMRAHHLMHAQQHIIAHTPPDLSPLPVSLSAMERAMYGERRSHEQP